MRRLLIAVVLVGVLAGCASSTRSTAAASTSEDTTTTDAQSVRLQDCLDQLNTAKANVMALLEQAPSAIATEGSPAAAASKMRADSNATTEIVDNAKAKCRSELPDCPTAENDYVTALEQIVAMVSGMADTLLGTTSSSPAPTATIPSSFAC